MPVPDPVAQTAATQSPAARAPAGTEYVVLEKVDDDGWIEAAHITTSSAAAAVSKHVGDRDLTGQTIAFVAVPARSWQPVKPKTTTKTITSLEPLT